MGAAFLLPLCNLELTLSGASNLAITDCQTEELGGHGSGNGSCVEIAPLAMSQLPVRLLSGKSGQTADLAVHDKGNSRFQEVSQAAGPGSKSWNGGQATDSGVSCPRSKTGGKTAVTVKAFPDCRVDAKLLPQMFPTEVIPDFGVIGEVAKLLTQMCWTEMVPKCRVEAKLLLQVLPAEAVSDCGVVEEVAKLLTQTVLTKAIPDCRMMA